MIEKNKFLTKDWMAVEDYLKKENIDSMKLAILEADKVFLKVIQNKGYKAKKIDDLIVLAVKELKRPELFLKTRENALALRDQLNYDIGDLYYCEEMISHYREAVNELLFGIIDGAKYQSAKMRFWPLYYRYYCNRHKITRFFVLLTAVVLLMLFVADTSIGRGLFDLFIEKAHLIIRTVLFLLFIAFLVLFFVTLSVVLLESRAKKKIKKPKS